MGPPLCSGGYQTRSRCRVRVRDCFNGATTLQWWIRRSDLLRLSASRIASMGPPLCSGGYGVDLSDHLEQIDLLQWGHHFAVVDTAPPITCL